MVAPLARPPSYTAPRLTRSPIRSYRTPLCLLYPTRIIAAACYVLAERALEGPQSSSLDDRIASPAPSASLPTPPSHKSPWAGTSRRAIEHFGFNETELASVAGAPLSPRLVSPHLCAPVDVDMPVLPRCAGRPARVLRRAGPSGRVRVPICRCFGASSTATRPALPFFVLTAFGANPYFLTDSPAAQLRTPRSAVQTVRACCRGSDRACERRDAGARYQPGCHSFAGRKHPGETSRRGVEAGVGARSMKGLRFPPCRV